ncbi:MAG: hypothetical protein ACIAQZ_07720 [Sedimentisphaeraceae bacterium JB056]
MLKTKKYINYSDIVSFSWNLVTSNIGLFIKVVLTYIIVLGITLGAQIYIEENYLSEQRQFDGAAYGQANMQDTYQTSPMDEGQASYPEAAVQAREETIAGVVNFVLSIVYNILCVVMGIGFFRIIFTLFDGGKAKLSMLFCTGGCFWRFVLTTILFYLVVLLGYILLIVPGIIFAVKFSLAPFFVIDKGLGPIQALKASSRATAYMKWHWFGFMFVAYMVMFAGFMVLGIGAIVSYPVGLVMLALGFRQLAAQTPELEEFGVKTMFQTQQPAAEPVYQTEPQQIPQQPTDTDV